MLLCFFFGGSYVLLRNISRSRHRTARVLRGRITSSRKPRRAIPMRSDTYTDLMHTCRKWVCKSVFVLLYACGHVLITAEDDRCRALCSHHGNLSGGPRVVSISSAPHEHTYKNNMLTSNAWSSSHHRRHHMPCV